ncbi:uncharacterized protein N7483_000916 [Penicillium malachiteum]|uniref:uncharacterized protein n=1 Tax=Penicillium malachiteum TaxID=1324776 RepID=UPI002549421F|nr:uncharacterized protein N7483_000916 [Penicillium malachiteum]KAJ5735791.1 hypothetical protein N7483_000916 [Penicillium malachiteum]
MADEQTFIAIKPDGVQRGLVGPIISRFENRGFKLVAMKLTSPGQELLEKHYADLATKPFFKGLVAYMLSGPICAMVWEGKDAVKTGRVILGATNPLASPPNAKKEIALWFTPSEVLKWKSAQAAWVYE